MPGSQLSVICGCSATTNYACLYYVKKLIKFTKQDCHNGNESLFTSTSVNQDIIC